MVRGVMYFVRGACMDACRSSGLAFTNALDIKYGLQMKKL